MLFLSSERKWTIALLSGWWLVSNFLKASTEDTAKKNGKDDTHTRHIHAMCLNLQGYPHRMARFPAYHLRSSENIEEAAPEAARFGDHPIDLDRHKDQSPPHTITPHPYRTFCTKTLPRWFRCDERPEIRCEVLAFCVQLSWNAGYCIESEAAI